MFEVHDVCTRLHYIPNKLYSVALNLFFLQSYQIASDQIERIRTNRRKVQDRWKSVLRKLGRYFVSGHNNT